MSRGKLSRTELDEMEQDPYGTIAWEEDYADGLLPREEYGPRESAIAREQRERVSTERARLRWPTEYMTDHADRMRRGLDCLAMTVVGRNRAAFALHTGDSYQARYRYGRAMSDVATLGK